eukprot:777393_1
MSQTAIVISLISIGYGIAGILIIYSATIGFLSNLYLLFALLLTGVMATLIRSDKDDDDFWNLFTIFCTAFGAVSCIAIPFVLWSGAGITGLCFGLGAVLTVFTFVS